MRLRLSPGNVARRLRDLGYVPGRDLRLPYPVIELDATDYPLGTTLVGASLVIAPNFGTPPFLSKQITATASAQGQITISGATGIGALYFALPPTDLLAYRSFGPLVYEVVVTDSLGRQATLDEGSLIPLASTAGNAVDHVIVTPSSFTLAISSTQQLIATAYDIDGQVLTGRLTIWTSSDPTVATVNVNGLVSAVADGAAIITATVEGVSDTSTATITAMTPTSFMAALNALGSGQALDLYVDASSPNAVLAAIGLASLTTVVDGAKPSGKRVTAWDSAINPGTGKHWRPSADFGAGNGANSDGLSVKGPGMELPASVGYGGGAAFHPDAYTLADATPGAPSTLPELLQDYTAGITHIVVGKYKINTNGLIELGDSTDAPNDLIYSADQFTNQQMLSDPAAGLGGILTDTASRPRVVTAWEQLPTTTLGVFVINKFGRDLFWTTGGKGADEGTTPALTSRRVRLFGNGGWNGAPQVEANIIIPFKGRPNGAQWKLINDVVKSWYPDVWDDPRANLVVWMGDSFEAPYHATPSEATNVIYGVDGAPVVASTAVACIAMAGHTPQTDQWAFVRMIADCDTSLRTKVGLLVGEYLNGGSLADNYYIADWWNALGAKYKSVLYDFTYNSNVNLAGGTTQRTDLLANWASHAIGLLDVESSLPYSSHNFGDGMGSWPGGENPLLWASDHPTQAAQNYFYAFFREAIRLLVGGDPVANTMKGDPSVDNVTLTAGAPTANPSIIAKNFSGATLGGKTWTHSTELSDGSSGAAVATADADGTIHRVAAGHCLRVSKSNDGAQCLVDVTCT